VSGFKDDDDLDAVATVLIDMAAVSVVAQIVGKTARAGRAAGPSLEETSL
jgi:hypothetical protein